MFSYLKKWNDNRLADEIWVSDGKPFPTRLTLQEPKIGLMTIHHLSTYATSPNAAFELPQGWQSKFVAKKRTLSWPAQKMMCHFDFALMNDLY